MKAKLIKESLDNILTFEELVKIAPQEIQDYIKKLYDTPQGTDYHPEGNCGIHTKIVFNRARKTGDINLMLASLFHDTGKNFTTRPNKKGGWSAHAHERISAKLVEKWKHWIRELGGDWKQVYEIVKEHMRIKQYDKMRPHKREILRNNKWFNKIKQFSELDDMMTLTDDELN